MRGDLRVPKGNNTVEGHGLVYWGEGGAHYYTSPAQMRCRGVQFFMVKQKNIGDIMKYTLYT